MVAMGTSIFILVCKHIVYVTHVIDKLLIKYRIRIRGILVVCQLIYCFVKVDVLIPGQLVFLVIRI